MKQEVYPSTRTINYAQDSSGRVLNVGTPALVTYYTGNIGYAPQGATASLPMSNGLTETTTYNARLQPVSIAAGSLLTLNLYYCASQATSCTSNNGNVMEQDIVAQGNHYDQTFWYDGANRLCEAAEAMSAIGLSSCALTAAPGGATWWQTHVYDATGNRATIAGGYGTSGNSQAQVSSVSASAVAAMFLHNQWSGAVADASGNLTTLSTGGAQATYDAENRIQSVTESTMPTIAYTYDGEGRRVQKTVGGVTTDYVYDATGALAAEYGGNAPIMAPTVWLTVDWLGSTRMETNSGGGVVALVDYAPFGEQLATGVGARGSLYGAPAYPSVTANAVEPEFTSKERDAESGLDYFGARYMSSAQGRFTSPDPLLSSGRPWAPQSWNRYMYALNNPLRYTDPTGLYEWDTTLGGGCTDKALNGGACEGVSSSNGKSIVSERKEIRNELKRPNQAKDTSLRAVGNSIGGENVDNGVTISMGKLGDNAAAAQVTNDLPLELNANGNPLLNLRVRPGASGDSLFIGLAHEGSHVWDAQSVASGNRDFVTHMATELSGYLETVTAAQSLGWTSVGPAGGTPFWSSSWSKIDQQTRPPQEIIKFLFTSPLYKDDLSKVVYTK